MIPKRVFFTKGVGRHKERLASFELALRDAGIEKFNLVCVSSILPPGCKIVTREKGLPDLNAGEIVHCVLARNETNENNRLIVSSIGCAIPFDSNNYGYLSEHHSFGETDEQAGEYAEDLAASMLATTLGVEFDPNQGWDEREQIYKMSGKIVRTRNITQSAEGKTGLWTTVIAVAVFIEHSEENKSNVIINAPQSAVTAPTTNPVSLQNSPNET
jgi:arginine decarboxylase